MPDTVVIADLSTMLFSFASQCTVSIRNSNRNSQYNLAARLQAGRKRAKSTNPKLRKAAQKPGDKAERSSHVH